MPLRTVDDDLVRRPLREQVQKQATQRPKIDLVSGEKALNAPVIGLLLGPGLQRQGYFRQICGRQRKDRRGKPGHELQPGEVPVEIAGKNVGQRAYVWHGKRVWCRQRSRVGSRSVLPGIGPVLF